MTREEREQALEWFKNRPITMSGAKKMYDLAIAALEQLEPCEDAVPRTSVEYICRKNTVSTNPYEHKYHDKFIQFMDDPEISDFGRWQHSNGFNTALVAVKCDLDKVPSVTPERKKGKWIRHDEIKNIYGGIYIECSECGEKYVVQYIEDEKFCRNCGADMRGEQDG